MATAFHKAVRETMNVDSAPKTRRILFIINSSTRMLFHFQNFLGSISNLLSRYSHPMNIRSVFGIANQIELDLLFKMLNTLYEMPNLPGLRTVLEPSKSDRDYKTSKRRDKRT